MLKSSSKSDTTASLMPFHIEVAEQDGRNLLKLTGFLDLSAARQLLAESLTLVQGSGSIAVDWSAAEYVHVSSLQVLLGLQSALAQTGRMMPVVGDSRAVRGFLELAGLSSHFRSDGGQTK